MHARCRVLGGACVTWAGFPFLRLPRAPPCHLPSCMPRAIIPRPFCHYMCWRAACGLTCAPHVPPTSRGHSALHHPRPPPACIPPRTHSKLPRLRLPTPLPAPLAALPSPLPPSPPTPPARIPHQLKSSKMYSSPGLSSCAHRWSPVNIAWTTTTNTNIMSKGWGQETAG